MPKFTLGVAVGVVVGATGVIVCQAVALGAAIETPIGKKIFNDAMTTLDIYMKWQAYGKPTSEDQQEPAPKACAELREDHAS